MFRKTVFAATAVILSVNTYSPAVASDGSTTIRDHRSTVVVRDHRSENPPRGNEIVRVTRKDCRLGYENLRRAGYDHVAVIDCSGARYKYLARKVGGLFRAFMHAYSGSMDVAYMGHAH